MNTIKSITPRILFLIAALIIFRPVDGNGQSSSTLEINLKESEPTQVLILGTPHLSQITESFEPELMDPLLTALIKYNPDAIGVEALSGEQIAAMETQTDIYKPILQQFAGSNLALRQQVNINGSLSWDKANQRADSLLTLNKLTSKQRLELIKLLLAAYRPNTASLHASYLPENYEAQSTLDDSLMTQLQRRYQSANETSSIGLRLAHDLGHHQIHPIDDHTEKDYFLKIAPKLQQELPDSVLAAAQQSPHLQKYKQLMDESVKNGNLLPLYRYMNSSDYLTQDVEAQWELFLRTNLPSKTDRSRLALWEVRNLNIAARIQKLVAQHPSGKILVIIGASHKAFLDDYLDRMMGVEIVQLRDLLNH